MLSVDQERVHFLVNYLMLCYSVLKIMLFLGRVCTILLYNNCTINSVLDRNHNEPHPLSAGI